MLTERALKDRFCGGNIEFSWRGDIEFSLRREQEILTAPGTKNLLCGEHKSATWLLRIANRPVQVEVATEHRAATENCVATEQVAARYRCLK